MQSNFFLVFIISLFSLCHLNCQWLANNYNPIGFNNAIVINGLPQPNSYDGYENLAYDFFIIYKNGTHFNSRYIDSNPFSGNGSSPYQLNFINQDFVPDYISLTKKYPPNFFDPTVSLSLPSTINNYNVADYKIIDIGTSAPTTITSNHDVVPGEDITLILPRPICNNNSMEFNNIEINYPESLSPKLMYQYVSSQPTSCVWGTNNYTYNSVTRIINIQNLNSYTAPYYYITFNANYETNTNDSMAHFTISTCNQYSVDFSQKIGPTHDPNFLKLNCIKYDIPHKAFCANYTLQFFNDGIVALEKAKAKFILLPDMIKSSLKLHSWQFGEEVGTEYAQNEFTKSFSNDTVVFNFFKGQLIPFRNPHLIPSSPYLAIVNFSIRFKSGVDISDINYNLKPQTPKTDFLPGIYDIPLFFDIQAETCHYEKKKKYRPTNKQCKCY